MPIQVLYNCYQVNPYFFFISKVLQFIYNCFVQIHYFQIIIIQIFLEILKVCPFKCYQMVAILFNIYEKI